MLWQVSVVALSSRAACAHAVEGRGLENRTLYSKRKTFHRKHRQDEEKHAPSASVEAEVDAAVSTATFSYSRLDGHETDSATSVPHHPH